MHLEYSVESILLRQIFASTHLPGRKDRSLRIDEVSMFYCGSFVEIASHVVQNSRNLVRRFSSSKNCFRKSRSRRSVVVKVGK